MSGKVILANSSKLSTCLIFNFVALTFFVLRKSNGHSFQRALCGGEVFYLKCWAFLWLVVIPFFYNYFC